jgi:predicted ArsR family transcriptional regulator
LGRTKLDERFFDSTRGRVVTLLRGGQRTVEELAGELGLTDNAVRAHLATLERDGLVRQRGVRRGFRKPHLTYALTREAEHLFPKAYDVLLNQLISVLKARLGREELEDALREVGRALAAAQAKGGKPEGSSERRIRQAVQALSSLGGAARVEKEGGTTFIRSEGGCPLSAAVSEHPEVCRLAEALIEQIVGTQVRERCERGEHARCRFEVLKSA